ncbi:MAG TPA: HAD-IA family hydrolase [Polyangiaceae bacterium]|nr:HAD-IA family hydrolase [Polyangiaceae bacterium]
MVKGILFDLDGTLFDRDNAIEDLVTDQHARFAAELATVSRDVYVSRLLELDAHGYGDKSALYRQVVSEFGLRGSLAQTLLEDFREKIESFGRAFPEVRSVLSTLFAQGLKLGIISNGSVRSQASKVSRLGVAQLMSAVLISESEGVRKPDPEIFRRALQRLALRADEVWFVGDHPVLDIEAAAGVGIAPIWRRTTHFSAPRAAHRQIDTLSDLLPFCVDVDESVEVVEYDARWPSWYQADATQLAQALGARLRAAEHFGSTAVPGLAAKPIIDVLLAPVEWPMARVDRELLERLGYQFLGEAGVIGRQYFRRRQAHDTNVAVVEFGGPLWCDNLLLRDYLRSHPSAALLYAQRKNEILSKGADRLLSYSAAKAPEVSTLLEAARKWRSA